MPIGVTELIVLAVAALPLLALFALPVISYLLWQRQRNIEHRLRRLEEALRARDRSPPPAP